ncbi:predicted protein [Naegleria gruberi]|uniref:Predicted protein n=1 Tax=Naegleria gruberi TaxID=5762 RepID=D2VDV2_NAEGR|nr:uncharacterized protein NAEGRDRAFT_67052 [Naegleria gruberi]EFC44966.1 predicted protein [Naegleria gruberi]|eukprot:XP_002677710.1 predicted protein [Naegleria gruberi strain NEG-M]
MSLQFGSTLLFAVLIIFLTYYNQSRLPSNLPVPNSIGAPVDYLFREDRALKTLGILSTTIGPKVVGTLQEKQAFEFVRDELSTIVHSEWKMKLENCDEMNVNVNGQDEEFGLKRFIRKEGNINSMKIKRCQLVGNNHKITLDQQFISGDGYIDILKRKLFTSYQNLTNLIVRIDPNQDRSDNHGLLVSSHFDSGVSSPGFYDDGIPVVCMIESFRNIVKMIRDGKLELKRSVIFLFNGAEETGLLGAESFMYHPYSRDVKYFLNLEAAGSGGKEVAFQIATEFLARHFAKSTVRASGNVIAQDIFQSNIIPSATDYHVYSSFGMQGIDVSFYKNGYVYHTSKDSSSSYEKGSIQHMGDNVQSFVTHFSNITENDSDPKTNFVYFDLFGFNMNVFDINTLRLINVSVIVISITLLIIPLIKGGAVALYHRVLALFLIFLFLLFAIGINITLTIGLMRLGYDMLYFAYHPMFSLVLYGSVVVTTFTLGFWTTNKFIIALSTEIMAESILILYTCILTLFTIFNIASGYLFLAVTIFLLLGTYFNKVYLDFSLIGLAFLSPILNQVIDMFIPITGRLGKAVQVDYIALMLCSIAVFLILTTLLPVLVRQISGKTVLLLILGTIITYAYLILGNNGKAFTEAHPKRTSIQHTFLMASNNLNDWEQLSQYIMIAGADSSKEEEITDVLGKRFNFERSHDTLEPQVVRSVINPRTHKKPYLITETTDSLPRYITPKIFITNKVHEKGRIEFSILFHEKIYHSGIFLYSDHEIVESSFDTNTSFGRVVQTNTDSQYEFEYNFWALFGYNRDSSLMNQNQKSFKFWIEFKQNPQKDFKLRVTLKNTFLANTYSLAELETELESLPWSEHISTTHSVMDFQIN